MSSRHFSKMSYVVLHKMFFRQPCKVSSRFENPAFFRRLKDSLQWCFCSDRVKKWLWFYKCVSTQQIRETYKPFINSTYCKILWILLTQMRDSGQYYRCFLQILMIERTHWLGLLRLLWSTLWDNSSLSTLLFIQNCKLYFSNETYVY